MTRMASTQDQGPSTPPIRSPTITSPDSPLYDPSLDIQSSTPFDSLIAKSPHNSPIVDYKSVYDPPQERASTLLNNQPDDPLLESSSHGTDPTKPLATMEKHLSIRKRADKAYRKNALRMEQKYSKQHKVKMFKPGDCVSVCVPRIDRASTDPQQLACVVVQVVGKAKTLYRLRCKFGVLKVCYSAGDLEEYHIRRNIGGALIWRIAESSHLADFNIGGRARGHVSSTLDEIILRI